MNTGNYIMAQQQPTEPITVRAAKETIVEIDALAAAMDRSRNYIVNQALQQYLEANAWQIARIKEGLAAAREGRVRPAEDVFADIAAKHGWSR
jgi:predicted transcriptional regulator